MRKQQLRTNKITAWRKPQDRNRQSNQLRISSMKNGKKSVKDSEPKLDSSDIVLKQKAVIEK